MLWSFFKVFAVGAVVARAEGGLFREAEGRAAVPSSAYHGDRGAVELATRGRHLRFVECHHLVVE